MLHFYSWGDSANLRIREVRTSEKRGITVLVHTELVCSELCRVEDNAVRTEQTDGGTRLRYERDEGRKEGKKEGFSTN